MQFYEKNDGELTVKMYCVLSRNGKTVFTMYFLNNSDTDSVYNVGLVKNYHLAEEIMTNLTTDQISIPTSYVLTASALTATPVVNITYYQVPEVAFNWLLDTIEGNMVLGLLMSIIFTVIMTITVCVFRKLCGDLGYNR